MNYIIIHWLYLFDWVPQSLEYYQSHLPKKLWTDFQTLSKSAWGTFQCHLNLRNVWGKGAIIHWWQRIFCWGSQSHRWHLKFKNTLVVVLLICINWLFIVWRYYLHAFLTSVHQKYNSLKKVLWVFKKKIFNNFRVLCYKLFYLPYLYLFVFWRKWRRTYLGSFIGHYEIVNCF